MKPQGNIREFPLRVVLTVTTGRLLTKPVNDGDNGINDWYNILEHMVGERPFTHQLGRFSKECKPWLFQWYPELGSPQLQFEVGKLSLMLETDTGKAEPEYLALGWLSGLTSSRLCREEYDIGQIPTGDHDCKHPCDELVVMQGTDKEIVLINLGEVKE